MLAPVLSLSREVDSAEPGAELQRIATDHRADEVGALANALVRYRARMRTAIEREMLFSADASHELRTPLCVCAGARWTCCAKQPACRRRAAADRTHAAQRR